MKCQWSRNFYDEKDNVIEVETCGNETAMEDHSEEECKSEFHGPHLCREHQDYLNSLPKPRYEEL